MWQDKKDLIRQQSAETMDQLAEATQSKGDSAALPACTHNLSMHQSSSFFQLQEQGRRSCTLGCRHCCHCRSVHN